MADNNSQDHQTTTNVYQFLDKMQTLQEVSLELSRAASLEDLYRQAIELGRSRLGFDRLGLLLYDEAGNQMHGLFGTDEQGNLRDERDFCESVEDPRLLETLHSQQRLGYWPEADLRDFGEVVGQGWNAMSVLWSGEKAIGWLAADNLINREPITYHLDILKLYGATLGHLISQKQSEETTRRNERALLSSLLDSIPDLIFYKNVDGVYLGCNAAFAEFAGRPEADIVGKTDFDMFPHEVAAFFREQDAEMMALGQARHNEEWVDYPDGRRVLLDTLKTPFYDPDKNLLGLIGISRDITVAYQAQAEVRRLGYVVEQSLDGTAVADLEGIIQFTNPTWAAMHGYTVDELIGQHLRIFHTPQQLTDEVEPFNRLALTSGQPQRAEIGHLRKDGVTFPTLMTIALLKDDQGNPIGLVASAQDITERKEVETTLRENQTRLTEATAIARLHYWEFDVATQQFTFLPEYYELLGTTAEEEGGYTMLAADYARKFVPEFEASIVEQEVVAALQTTDPNYYREFDSYNLTKDGRIFPIRVRFRVVKDQEGQTIKTIGANQDITEQVKAEHALRESQARAETILQAVTVPMLISQVHDGQIVYANEYLAQTVRLPLDKLVGNATPNFYVRSEDRTAVVGQIQAQGHVQNYQLQLRRDDGELFWALLSARLIDFQGEPSIITSLIDISDRIIAEETLLRQARDLQTAANISTAVRANLQNQEDLLQQVVDLTQERFAFYHAHIYLLDGSGQTLSLAAGAGEVGRTMTAEGHRIPLNQEQSIVARAARTRQSRISNDVLADPSFLPHPLLPHTRAEMAVPMISGHTLIGVLDVQADRPNAFTSEDADIQITLATQIAIAVENARLLAESQQAVAELDALTRRLTRESWESYLKGYDQEVKGFAYDLGQLRPLADTAVTDLTSATVSTEPAPNGLLAHPLTVRGEPIGHLALLPDEDDDTPTAVDPLEVEAIIAAVAEQLSARIENIRLTEQTQAALSLTERLYQAGHRINSAGADLQEALAAVSEASPIPVVNRAVLFLFERSVQGEMQAIVSVANWHNGRGAVPTAVGTRYEREAMAALNLMLTQETLLFDNAMHDERIDPVTRGIFKALNIQSLVVVPLWVGRRQLGSVLLEAEEVHHFTEKEIEPYVALAGQLAIAVDRQRLLDEAQVRAERERQIRTITDKVRRGADRQAILETARQEISQMLGAKIAAGQLGTSAQLLERLGVQAKTPANGQTKTSEQG